MNRITRLAHAARLGLIDGFRQPHDLTMGMTWDDDEGANELYDRSVNVGQRLGRLPRRRIAIAAAAIALAAALTACRPTPVPMLPVTDGTGTTCHVIWDDEFDEFFESFTPELRADGRWYDPRFDRPIGYSFPGYSHAMIDCGFWGLA